MAWKSLAVPILALPVQCTQYFLIYKMSISDYKHTILLLKASTGMVYDEIQAAYIDLWIIGYFAFHSHQTL